MYKIDKTSSPLWWVILLLATVVILPTVCLLWFMTQAVKNERLAVRQKLIDIYAQQLQQIAHESDRFYRGLASGFVKRIERSETETGLPPIRLMTNLAAMSGDHHGVIVYDPNGHVEFPQVKDTDAEPASVSDELRHAWKVEFITKDHRAAAMLYGKLATTTDDNRLKARALVSKARCLAKAGLDSEAITICKYLFIAFTKTSMEHDAFDLPPNIVINNYVMLIELYTKTNQDYDDLADALLVALGNSHWPLPIREFGLEKLRTFTDGGNTIQNRSRRAQFRHLYSEITATSQSVSVAEKYPHISMFGRWNANTIQRVKMPEPLYVFFLEDETRKYAVTGPPDMLFRYTNVFREDSFVCKFKDNTGDYLNRHGTQIQTTKPVLSAAMGGTFPEWTVELYMKDANLFDDAANRQAAIYTWTGVLVVLLILSSGAMAAKVISRQIKLNRLKNDFIATVTHELKTPLSSMRVLVDTLLEGNYNDPQTATEYLQLISKENIRLSRLIDNFLTFSRMERNKQAFDMARTNPAEIAKDAAEAVQTKVKHQGCRFSVTIDDDLPSIMADKDAMVTVLVNLLDNAYKYSYDNKQIELKVFAEAGNVCFSVKDNGIGMTRKQIRKIFNRFYQADSSLSRQAEGTGLGLSIVKFIVAAHKGEIIVNSEPGKGSEFIIEINTNLT